MLTKKCFQLQMASASGKDCSDQAFQTARQRPDYQQDREERGRVEIFEKMPIIHSHQQVCGQLWAQGGKC